MARTVYLVQKLDWQWNDEFFVIDEEIPVKVFARLSRAEGYRQKLEAEERNKWTPERDAQRRGDTTRFYEVLPVEID